MLSKWLDPVLLLLTALTLLVGGGRILHKKLTGHRYAGPQEVW